MPANGDRADSPSSSGRSMSRRALANALTRAASTMRSCSPARAASARRRSRASSPRRSIASAACRSTPCGECGACREIDEGRFVDLLEVDAASRTKVDDTRELLDNVQYPPTRGRYKVYLIDEVHMLSAHSFNALLKTLEEPPPHVKFLLATTDPQKLPVTVLSRCLQFNLQAPAASADQRAAGADPAAREGVAFEPAALRAARARRRTAACATRCRCSTRCSPSAAAACAEAEARSLLGTVDRQHVEAILAALAAGDGAALMQCVATLDERAPDYTRRWTSSPARCSEWRCSRRFPELGPTRTTRTRRWPRSRRAFRRRTCSSATRSRSWAAAISTTHPMRAADSRWRCCACWRSVRCRHGGRRAAPPRDARDTTRVRRRDGSRRRRTAAPQCRRPRSRAGRNGPRCWPRSTCRARRASLRTIACSPRAAATYFGSASTGPARCSAGRSSSRSSRRR